MRGSTWFFIAGAVWIAVEQFGAASATGNFATTLLPTLTKVDSALPGGATIPGGAGTYLLGIGAIMRFGFNK